MRLRPLMASPLALVLSSSRLLPATLMFFFLISLDSIANIPAGFWRRRADLQPGEVTR